MPVLLISFLLLLASASTFPLRIHSASSVPSSVTVNTDLSPISNTKILVSPNDLFELLFIQWQDSGSSYCLSGLTYTQIAYSSAIWSFDANDSTTAAPVTGSSCILRLASDGDLSLQHDNGVIAWSSHTSGLGVVNVTLRDDGDLVLLDSQLNVVWSSFHAFSSLFFLPAGINFTQNYTLYERISVSRAPDFSTPGDYAMALSPRGHLLLLLRSNMFAYHSFSASAGSVDAISATGVRVDNALEFYNDTGGGNGSKQTIQLPPNNGASPPNSSFPVRFGYLEDGNFLVNYWNGSQNPQIYNTSVDYCHMPYSCGQSSAYKICTADPDGMGFSCACPDGFAPDAANSHSCTTSDTNYDMKPINVLFHPQYSYVTVKSRDECAHRCSANATCRAALFDSSTLSCSFFPVLYTLPKGANDSQVMLVKVYAASRKPPVHAIAGAVAAAAVFFLVVGLVLIFVVRRRRRLALERRDEMFLADLPRLPPRFTYKELRAATWNFSKLLGKGGFGSVYEGVLGPTRVKVAVKKLDGGGGGGQSADEFRAEVATIGSVSHVNLVRLRGFCMEGSVRMLVYEFMENGSLDRWLFKKPQPQPAASDVGGEEALDWETRCRIALDTARGLEYLHHRSAEHIVHCDVKPENILLGHGFHAKVADFGLARLLGAEDQSFAMTTLKGTRGYLAPEWLQDTSVNFKSDVYSYGVVLLELITGKRCLGSDAGYLPTWAMSVASSMPASTGTISAAEFDLQEMVLDGRLVGKTVLGEALERLFALAVACVQMDPAKRPTMTTVVQVLEEDVLRIERAAPLPPLGSTDETVGEYRLESAALLKASMGSRSDGGGGEEAAALSGGWGAYPSRGLVLPPR